MDKLWKIQKDIEQKQREILFKKDKEKGKRKKRDFSKIIVELQKS